ITHNSPLTHSPLTTHHSPPATAVSFLLHFPDPWPSGDGLGRWALPTTVSCGARTFLSSARDDRSRRGTEQRPSSRLADTPILIDARTGRKVTARCHEHVWNLRLPGSRGWGGTLCERSTDFTDSQIHRFEDDTNL